MPVNNAHEFTNQIGVRIPVVSVRSHRSPHQCVRRTLAISCEAVPARSQATAGTRRHLPTSSSCRPCHSAAESFVSFIALFGGTTLTPRVALARAATEPQVPRSRGPAGARSCLSTPRRARGGPRRTRCHPCYVARCDPCFRQRAAPASALHGRPCIAPEARRAFLPPAAPVSSSASFAGVPVSTEHRG